MSVQSSKFLLTLALTGILGQAPVRMFAQAAAAPASAAPQKNWKDRAEYDLYVSIGQDQNAKTRLEKLLQWEKQYPMTEWLKERKTLFLTTYAANNDPKSATEAAKQILADDPKDFTALYYTMLFTHRAVLPEPGAGRFRARREGRASHPGQSGHASSRRGSRRSGPR